MSLDQENIEVTLSHLPKFSDEGILLDGSTASRVRAIFERKNGGLSRLLEAQINFVTESLKLELPEDTDGNIVMSEDQIRGLIARSAIGGAAQAIFSAAESIEDGHRLDAIVYGEETAS